MRIPIVKCSEKGKQRVLWECTQQVPNSHRDGEGGHKSLPGHITDEFGNE